MKQKYNILIPNATSARNVGDVAILTSLINLIKKEKPDSYITIHSSEPELHHNIGDEIKSNLYWATVFKNPNAFVRIYKLAHLFLLYFSYKIGLKNIWCKCELGILVEDYENADLIVFVGGGYLRSKLGLSQSLNLLMVASSFEFASLFNIPKIAAPMSFGPFAYKWQEKYSASILKKMDLVEVREDVSYKSLKKYFPKLIRGYDQALLIPQVKRSKTNIKPIIGFTIRNWLDKEQQELFEKSYSAALSKFSKKTGSNIQPIVQVDAPMHKIENDSSATSNVINFLKNTNSRVLNTKKISSLNNAISTYSQLDMLLGMRMHSNIIAATQNVPFVAVAYEYKTQGIAKDLGVESYCINADEVNEEKLYNLLSKGFKNRTKLRTTINSSLNKIRQEETRKWRKNFQKYINL